MWLGATNRSLIVPATEFFTEFLGADENPLSEGGKWDGGKTVGIDWQDFKLAGNRACAAAFSSTSQPPFDDAIAILKSSAFACTPNQFAEIQVFRAGGYSPPGTHEFGMFTRFNLSAHVASGYEAYLNHGSNFSIVRWNGAVNDFTPLTSTGPGPTAPVNGDVLRFTVVGSTLSYYQNSVLVATATDTTFTSGQPGLQSYVISTSTLASYCAENFRAGNL